MAFILLGFVVMMMSYTARSPCWRTAFFILGGVMQIGGSVCFIAFTSAPGSWGGHWLPAMILTIAGAEVLGSDADGAAAARPRAPPRSSCTNFAGRPQAEFCENLGGFWTVTPQNSYCPRLPAAPTGVGFWCAV